MEEELSRGLRTLPGTGLPQVCHRQGQNNCVGRSNHAW